MVTKRLHKLKQTCSWKLHVCLKYVWPFCYHQALKGLDMVTRLILKNFVNILRIHCVKSVQIRNFFWSVFPAFSPNTGKYWPKGHSHVILWSRSFKKLIELWCNGATILMRETVNRGVVWKKLFLKILQNSQENTYVEVSF